MHVKVADHLHLVRSYYVSIKFGRLILLRYKHVFWDDGFEDRVTVLMLARDKVIEALLNAAVVVHDTGKGM